MAHSVHENKGSSVYGIKTLNNIPPNCLILKITPSTSEGLYGDKSNWVDCSSMVRLHLSPLSFLNPLGLSIFKPPFLLVNPIPLVRLESVRFR